MTGSATMIYTSYYAMLDKQPATLQPVSISRGTYRYNRDAINAPKYWPLCPSKALHELGWGDLYVSEFKEQLRCLEIDQVYRNLLDIMRDNWHDPSQCKGIVLYCYEKPEKRCHRHLVAEWLRANSIPCTELAYSPDHAARYPDDVQTTLIFDLL